MSNKKQPHSLPGFEIDPVTGEYYWVPIDFKAYFDAERERTKKSDSKSKCSKDNGPPSKFYKSKTGARKALFKMPVDLPQDNPVAKESKVRKPYSTQSNLIKPLSLTSTKSTELIKAQKNNTTQNKVEKSMEYRLDNSLKLLESPEFLKLEQQCKTPKVGKDSPLSSVCSLFQNKMLLDGDKENVPKLTDQKKIISDIQRLINLDQKLCQDTASKIKQLMEQQTKHEENLNAINDLLGRLIDFDDNPGVFKEQSASKRRSLRLQNKSPSELSKPATIAVSPVILKAGDLRKSALTKSLVEKCQKYKIESPRLKKALDMYNETKSGCSALLTPKAWRGTFVASPVSSTLRKNLSAKVQKQCLMLQDTPKGK